MESIVSLIRFDKNGFIAIRVMSSVKSRIQVLIITFNCNNVSNAVRKFLQFDARPELQRTMFLNISKISFAT